MIRPTNLTKLLAEYFYAVTLHDCEKNEALIPDKLLEQYATDDGRFDIDRLIEDTKTGAFKKEYYNFLLPEDLLTADTGTLKEIEKAYAAGRSKSLKGGYIRAVLDVLYDKRFREEFNKKTDGFLEKASERQDFILLFLNRASTQDGRGERRWNYSEATEIKQIGKKEKGSVVEMVNNPYSAYKLFGQGEYSKLLIGCRAIRWPSMDGLQQRAFGISFSEKDVYTFSLTDLRKKGMEAILADKAVCMYTTKEGKEILIIPDGRFDKKTVYDGKWERNANILFEQMKAITTVLQHFNDYIPYELDEELELALHNECTRIYFKYNKKDAPIGFSSTNEQGFVFSKNEADFVNRYFNYVVDGLFDSNRKAFDEASGYFFTSNKDTITDKIQSLSMLVGSKALAVYPDEKVQEWINGLSDNEIWQGILNKYRMEFGDPFYASDDNGDGYDIDDADAESDAFSSDKKLTPEEQLIQKESISDDAKYLKHLFRVTFPKKQIYLTYIEAYIDGIEKRNFLHLNGKSKKASKNKALISTLCEIFPDKKTTIKEKFSKADTVLWDNIAYKYCLNKNDCAKLKKAKMYFALRCLGMGDKHNNWDIPWKFFCDRELTYCTDDASKELAKNSFRREMDDIARTFRKVRSY